VLLGRHKSWVCRRLALAESLSDELRASVRLGLVAATAAAELARLQRCNQDAVMRVVTQRGLTTRQTAHLVQRLLAAPAEQWPVLLDQASTVAPAPAPKGDAEWITATAASGSVPDRRRCRKRKQAYDAMVKLLCDEFEQRFVAVLTGETMEKSHRIIAAMATKYRHSKRQLRKMINPQSRSREIARRREMEGPWSRRASLKS